MFLFAAQGRANEQASARAQGPGFRRSFSSDRRRASVVYNAAPRALSSADCLSLLKLKDTRRTELLTRAEYYEMTTQKFSPRRLSRRNARTRARAVVLLTRDYSIPSVLPRPTNSRTLIIDPFIRRQIISRVFFFFLSSSQRISFLTITL